MQGWRWEKSKGTPHSGEEGAPEPHFLHGSLPHPLPCSHTFLLQPAEEAEVERTEPSSGRKSPGPCGSADHYAGGLGWGLRVCVSKNLEGASITATPCPAEDRGSRAAYHPRALPSPPDPTHPFPYLRVSGRVGA